MKFVRKIDTLHTRIEKIVFLFSIIIIVILVMLDCASFCVVGYLLLLLFGLSQCVKIFRRQFIEFSEVKKQIYLFF